MKVCLDIQASLGQRAGVGRYVRELLAHLGPEAGTDELSAFYFDFNNQFRTFEARRQLEQGGKSHNDDLLRLVNDEAEDLDVRLEAMNWFYEFNRAEARRALRRLRSDENPEVVDKANSLLEQVESDAAGQRQGR